MSESGITPLAQRLAEENNVDWRTLTGSGDGGRIVERDVLEYLAKVMAGEEAVNPTPEPMPDGMAAWPEADGWAGERVEQVADNDWSEPAPDAAEDGLDWPAGDDATDFGTPVAFDAEQAELRASGEWPAAESAGDFDSKFGTAAGFLDGDEDEAGDEFGLSEDIFLFDDEVAEPEVVTETELTGADPVLPDLTERTDPLDQRGFDLLADPPADDDAELFLSVDDAMVDDAAEPAHFLDDDEQDLLADIDLLEVEPEEPAADSEEGSPAEQEFGRSEAAAAGQPDDLLGDEEFEAADLTDLASLDGELDDLELAGAEDSLQEFEAGFSMESLEERAPEFPVDGLDEPDAGTYAFEQGDDHFEQEQEVGGPDRGGDAFDIDFSGAAAERPADAWQDGVELAGELQTQSDRDEADALARRIEAAFESVADARPEFEEFGADLDGAAGAGLPLADFGKLLRRQLDVSELQRAQDLVGSEISGGESVSASAFLLRAASRASADSTFAAAAPAVALIQDERIELVSDSGGGFRALAQKLGEVVAGELPGDVGLGAIGLAVADMSSLEVDEAVLDLGVPVLSLGRILRDEESGVLRSTLTLSGRFDLQEGARFLQAVSELLSSPLRLLL